MLTLNSSYVMGPNVNLYCQGVPFIFLKFDSHIHDLSIPTMDLVLFWEILIVVERETQKVIIHLGS